MSITKLTTNGIVGAKYDTVSADNYYMEPIATTLLGSSAASVTFSNIPQTYKHLQLRGIARDSRATYGNSGPSFQFNGDTGANYSWHGMQGDGGSATARNGTTQNQMYGNAMAGNGAPANTYGAFIIDILDYSNVYKFKTMRMLDGVDLNGTVAGFGGIIELMSGLWMNTAGITSITMAPSNPNWLTNSRFSLYGIRG